MTLKELEAYCLAKPGSVADFPFDQETMVFKAGNKMFALANINSDPPKVNLKCDPLLAQDLRERYEEVEPGYHMNKRHWNTVGCQGNLPDSEIKKMIDLSYELVVKSLTKKTRKELGLGEDA